MTSGEPRVGDDVNQFLEGDKAYFARETASSIARCIHWPSSTAECTATGARDEHSATTVDDRVGPTRQDATRLDRRGSREGWRVTIHRAAAVLTVVTAQGADHHYTLERNSAHLNVSTLFDEAKNRVPDEDTLTIVDGFLGSYPNAFFHVSSNEVPVFMAHIAP